jgi:hypothetical protein
MFILAAAGFPAAAFSYDGRGHKWPFYEQKAGTLCNIYKNRDGFL